MTLPDSIANVVDNLQSKSDLTYLDVRTRLLKLASSSLIDTPKKNKALNARGKRQGSHTTAKSFEKQRYLNNHTSSEHENDTAR